jgi:D-glycero-D-manno-heptose 1,7-bisphosphate phosphatase
MKTAFLDRDGVINVNRPDHVMRWSDFVFLPGTLDALRRLHEAGWQVIVITNQAIVNRRLVSASTVESIHQQMVTEVAASGGKIHGVYYCPHDHHEGCGCRKPEPGLLRHAAEQFDITFEQSYLVGDALTDIAAGQAVGCECILVQTGRGPQQLMNGWTRPMGRFHILPDLATSVDWILFQEKYARLYEMPWPARLLSARSVSVSP